MNYYRDLETNKDELPTYTIIKNYANNPLNLHINYPIISLLKVKESITQNLNYIIIIKY